MGGYESSESTTDLESDRLMWLHLIEQIDVMTAERAYCSTAELKADLQQIVENCKADNAQGTGKHGNPSKLYSGLVYIPVWCVSWRVYFEDSFFQHLLRTLLQQHSKTICQVTT